MSGRIRRCSEKIARSKWVVFHRRHITLIEIMIVIMILGLVTGIVGINVNRAIKAQRLRTEVDLMVDTLRTAQDLMLILKQDVHVRVKAREDNKGIEYWLDSQDGIPEKWKAAFERPPRLLRETHGVFFRELEPFPITQGELDIRFESEGTQMSRGVLRMSTHEDERASSAVTYAICLKGYPHPISAVLETPDHPVECQAEETTNFDGRLTLYTVEEVMEDSALRGITLQDGVDEAATQEGKPDEQSLP